MAEINVMVNMKKNKDENSIDQSDINALLLTWNDAIRTKKQFQETLLQAAIVQALEFWLQKARISYQDRGTISNYYAYIKDLLQKGILSHKQANKGYFRIFELSDLYDEIVERINDNESFKINDRRYRIKALLAFTRFLHEETDGKVRKLIAPPILMPVNDTLPALANDSSNPRVLTDEEFQRVSDVIRNPKDRNFSSNRDYLVIEIMYQTARPLLDILALQKANMDFSNQSIIFFNKSNESISVPISPKLKNGLEIYIDYSQSNRKDEMVFITREGNSIFRTHFYQVLKNASKAADLGFTATFKMIQWAYVAKRIKTDKSDQKIMKELKLKKLPKYLESLA